MFNGQPERLNECSLNTFEVGHVTRELKFRFLRNWKAEWIRLDLGEELISVEKHPHSNVGCWECSRGERPRGAGRGGVVGYKVMFVFGWP